MSRKSAVAHNRRFLRQPHRTLLSLSLPILLSLIAEPVTGLIDTGFVAQLGKVPLAALGVGSGAMSSLFWMFGFLGIATQTNVATAFGRRDLLAASKALSLALVIGIVIIMFCGALLLPGAGVVAELLGAEGQVLHLAREYVAWRMLGAPAVMITFIGFGALRGIQDMKTPLKIALCINGANIILDYALIFGVAFLPALGVAGAALASSLAQWLGACIMLRELNRRLGLTRAIKLREGIALLRVGRDLFIRTGSLIFFTLVATRVATQMGAEAGAAHQVIRQFWFFTALVMEAFATTAQSLIGYFCGSNQLREAKRVAATTTWWGLGVGAALGIALLLAEPLVRQGMVPPDAAAVFGAAWAVSALSMPLNALAFITDGIHKGASDYGYLRNAMIISTLCGLVGLGVIASDNAADFTKVWLVSALWIAIRSFWGVIRVFPGIGRSPFRGL